MSSPASANVSPSISSAGAAMRQYLQQKGGAVVNSASTDAQIEAKFGPQPKAKLHAAPGTAPLVSETPKATDPVGITQEPAFVLEPEPEPVIRIARGKKARQEPQPGPAKPSLLVEYEAKLEGGAVMSVPEYAHVARLDAEVLTLGFPISQKSRLRPARGTNLNIRTRHGTHSCYSTGIHTDIPEWGVSMSIFLINPEEKE